MELFYRSQTSLNVNTLSANPTKWSNTLKQFIGKLPMNCLSVFDHFVGLALKGLKEGLSQFCKNFQKKKKKIRGAPAN